MDVFREKDLKDLVQWRGGPLVSLYMPMHREPDKNDEDRIRLKNLLAQAGDLLQSQQGLAAEEVEILTSPIQEQADSGALWRPRGNGLAVFAGSDFLRTFRLPLRFEELAIAGDRFHLKPLLPLLSENERFFVLSLSQKHTRLYRGARDALEELEVPGMPESVEEILKYDDPQRQLQFHTGTQPRPGSRAAQFHGQGVGHDDANQNLERFVKALHKPLHKFLAGEKSPLVLAGTLPLMAMFRAVANDLNLTEEWIDKNPESLNEKELHGLAWEAIKPILDIRRENDVERYQEMKDKGLSIGRVREIVPAAANKRIDTLFVALHRHVWGSWDHDTGRLRISDRLLPGTHDLLDMAATHTIEYGGVVHAMLTGQVPDGGPAAAILRY